MAKKMHYILPAEVKLLDGVYYIHRPWLINGLSKYFNLYLHTKVTQVNDLDKNEYMPFNNDIKIIDHFDEIDPKSAILNYQQRERKLHESADFGSDLFFVDYPFRKTSIIYAHMLRDTQLVIRVISDYVTLYTIVAEGLANKIFKNLTKPIIKILFPKISSSILDNSIVFYNGDILYNSSNHINQYESLAIPPLNKKQHIINKDLNKSLIFVGSDSYQKGLDILVKALESYHTDIPLSIIGMDSMPEQLIGSDIDVKIHGKVYDPEIFYKILSQHDLLVLPSRGERQGQVQLEAMSAGVVPICADTGAVYRTIQNMYNGLLFEEGNHEHLAEQIEKIYQAPGLYERLLENSLDYTSDLSMEENHQRIAEIIKNHYLVSEHIK